MNIETSPMKDIPGQQIDWPGLTDEMTPTPDHGETSYVGRERLTGKKALVTGGDSGIGAATAIAFAKEGADVAIAFLPEEQPDAEHVRDVIEKAGRRAVLIPGDLRTEDECHRTVSEAVEALGGLDIVVNNAGYQWGRKQGLGEITADGLQRTFQTNVYATIWTTQAALPHLKAGASIINCTSIQAFDPSEALMDYAATKAALNNLTVSMAADLGPKGIRVNGVAPGPVWTPLQPATKTVDSVEGMGTDTPLGRAGQPIEVATAFVYLASDEASYVSATILGVTGGRPVF